MAVAELPGQGRDRTTDSHSTHAHQHHPPHSSRGLRRIGYIVDSYRHNHTPAPIILWVAFVPELSHIAFRCAMCLTSVERLHFPLLRVTLVGPADESSIHRTAPWTGISQLARGEARSKGWESPLLLIQQSKLPRLGCQTSRRPSTQNLHHPSN